MTTTAEMSIAKAINAGIQKQMQKDSKVLVFGEDVAELGGVFRVTEGLLAEFGNKRVFNSPIAESGIDEFEFEYDDDLDELESCGR